MHQVLVEKNSVVRLPDLIDTVINGDEVIFTDENLPVAKLVAVHQYKPQPKFGSARGLFVMSEDFEAPLEDFDDYLQ